MPYRANGITLSLNRVGAGSVVLDAPQEDLLPADRNRIDAPLSPSTLNLRLINGVAELRPGYTELGSSLSGDPIIGLHTAVFEDGVVRTLRVLVSGRVQQHTSGAWADINDFGGTPVVFTATSAARTRHAMVIRTGTVSPKNEIMVVNGVDKPFAWTGGVAIDSVTGAPSKAKSIVSFLNRAFLFNCDDGLGNRKGSRVQWSATNDPRTWTGISSGFGDLLDDPYDIQRAGVMSGGLVVLKGTAEGGSLYRGTPTGQVLAPVRYDAINPNTGIGILCPNTFLMLTPGVCFFLGHDGFYYWDGMRTLQNVPFEGITKHILRRLNHEALEAAFSWYKPKTQEIHVALPTGTSEVANEIWVYNRNTKQVYPYEYTNNMNCAATYVPSTSTTWEDLDPFTWNTLPYASWDDIGGTKGGISAIFGDSDGATYVDTEIPGTPDANVVFEGQYTTAPLRIAGRVQQKADGTFVAWSERDAGMLHDVTIVFEDRATWTPIVQYRIEGGGLHGTEDKAEDWVTISDGVEIGGLTNRLLKKSYTADAPAAEWYQIRVKGSETMFLHSLVVEFTYGGDERAAGN